MSDAEKTNPTESQNASPPQKVEVVVESPSSQGEINIMAELCQM